MTAIRPFVAEDVPQAADLHRRVFGTAEPDAPGWEEAYRRYFSEVFLTNPAGDDALTSLVAEDRSGRIIAFLGVVPRRLWYRGRPILAALCSQFVVDPSSRGQVGLRMVKHCLGGPQDLSISDEAEQTTGTIWRWCGGMTALLHSMRWIRPLQPAQATLAMLGSRSAVARARFTVPAARLLDTVVTRWGPGPFRRSPCRGSREDLDAGMLPGWLSEVAAERALRPDHDHRSVRWMVGRAAGLRRHGMLRTMLVRDDRGRPIGWYIYYANAGGIGEVLQIGARSSGVRQVLDHLIDDARQHAVAALCGRLDPTCVREMSEAHCLLHRRGFSMVVHSRRPELLDAIRRGDAFFTRLEGEWCLHYQ